MRWLQQKYSNAANAIAQAGPKPLCPAPAGFALHAVPELARVIFATIRANHQV